MIVHYTNRFSLMSSKTAWVACAQTVKKVERVGGRGDGKCMGIGVKGAGRGILKVVGIDRNRKELYNIW